MDKVSGFAYQPGGHPEYTTTAAGLLAMQVCGEYESPFVLGGADWLLKHKPQANRKYFFMVPTITPKQCIKGEMNTPRWVGNGSKKFFCPCKRKAVRGKVVQESGHGEVYATSMALLALAVKYHYLPIYQR